jgi:elongation factor 1-beta
VTVGEAKASASSSAAPKAEADEDDIDLFGSDDDLDEEAEKVKAARVAEYEAKKSNKPAVTAKSQVVLDVKPWDDETDMDALTKHVKSIEMDGLLWGAHKLVAVGYGIKKLQITVSYNLV